MRFGSLLAAAALSYGTLLGAAHASDGASKTSSGWGNTEVHTSGTSGATFTAEQMSAVDKVSGYFNGLTSLEARFAQTDPDGRNSRGRFFVERPGKFRFEYGAPSVKVVVSDGTYLAIEERDQGTEETYELADTPFKMLLKSEVNLARDSQVLLVEETAEEIAVVVRDKDPDVPGLIKVVMLKAPELTLRGWITRDAQGLETKVEVQDAKIGGDLDDKLFARSKFFMNRIRQR